MNLLYEGFDYITVVTVLTHSFIQHFLPLLNDNYVIPLRLRFVSNYSRIISMAFKFSD